MASEDVALLELAPEAQSEFQGRAMSSERRLIRSGSARIEVEEVGAAVTAARELAVNVGGYLAGSELSEGREGSRSASLLLRVPSDSIDSVVGFLPRFGRVLSVSLSTTDVSREYVDVETRLAVQEESVTRLRALAARGGSLEDLLAAERELGRAVSDLEVLKGQMRYFDQRIAESDLRLSLVEPGGVVGTGAFRPLVMAARRSVEVFAESMAYLVYLIVFLAPWVLLTALLWPLARRWRRKLSGRDTTEPIG